MRFLFWMALALAATLAVLLGLYVGNWIEDVYPLNIVYFGHRLVVFLALGLGLCLAALAAVALSVRKDRQRAAAATESAGPSPHRLAARPDRSANEQARAKRWDGRAPADEATASMATETKEISAEV